MSYFGSWHKHRAYSEQDILSFREINPFNRLKSSLGFSLERIRDLDRTKAKIEHDGCINIVKWHPNGQGFISGSDDREIKYWSLTHDVERVSLKQSVRTRHRGNIFYIDFDPTDANIYYSCAADGTLRSSHALQRNVGDLLRNSDDMIHMFLVDQDQPKVVYTAEESGLIYRIDTRTGQSEKLFQHSTHVYRAFAQANPYFQSIPSWATPGAVKSLIQNGTYSAPHLVVGGQGFAVGLLDLRLASGPEMRLPDARGNTPPAITNFVKLWCPLFPMNTSDRNHSNIYEAFKCSTLTHPYSVSNHEAPTDLKATVRKVEGVRAHGIASISGLDISKDGQRILASFQNDQIYTFDFYENNDKNCYGPRAMIGGHSNYATFLKSVHFFGQRDEYVVAGSDTGHMWVWTSSPRCVPGIRAHDGEEDHWYDAITCPVLNILKADNRTCNGAAPHPTELLLVSYGIDSTAKLWAVRDPTDRVSDVSVSGNSGSTSAGAANATAAGNKKQATNTPGISYALCRHEGARDRGRYVRMSLVKSLMSSRPRSVHCALASLPHLLEETKKSIGIVFPDYLESSNTKNIVMFPSDFVSNAMVNRQCLLGLEVVLPGLGDPKYKEYFSDDYGAYMPSDSLHLSLRQGVGTKLMSDFIFGTVKHLKGWQSHPNAFWHRLLRRFWTITEMRIGTLVSQSMDYFTYIPYRSLEKKRHKLFNMFFLPVLELCRIAESTKSIGSQAFRNKDYVHSHFFYCKAQRYIEYVFQLRLVRSLSTMAVKDSIPIELWSAWSKEQRLQKLPRPMYDIAEPQVEISAYDPIQRLSRASRARMANQLERMGIEVNRSRLGLLPTRRRRARSTGSGAVTAVVGAPAASSSSSSSSAAAAATAAAATADSSAHSSSASSSNAASNSNSSSSAMDVEDSSSLISDSTNTHTHTNTSDVDTAAGDNNSSGNSSETESRMQLSPVLEQEDEEGESGTSASMSRDDTNNTPSSSSDQSHEEDDDDDDEEEEHEEEEQGENDDDEEDEEEDGEEGDEVEEEDDEEVGEIEDGDSELGLMEVAGSDDDGDHGEEEAVTREVLNDLHMQQLLREHPEAINMIRRAYRHVRSRRGGHPLSAAAEMMSNEHNMADNNTRSSRVNTSKKEKKAAATAGKAPEDESAKAKRDDNSDIDEAALQGDVVRFFAPEWSISAEYVKAYRRRAVPPKRIRAINRRYWRKVTLHPQGPHRLLRVLPTSNATASHDNCSANEELMQMYSSNENSDAEEEEEEATPHSSGASLVQQTSCEPAAEQHEGGKDGAIAAASAAAAAAADIVPHGDTNETKDVASVALSNSTASTFPTIIDTASATTAALATASDKKEEENVPPATKKQAGAGAGASVAIGLDIESVWCGHSLSTALAAVDATKAAALHAEKMKSATYVAELLKKDDVNPEDAENDALLLSAEDAKYWFRDLKVYDPVWRAKQRQMLSRAKSTTSTTAGDDTHIALSDRSEDADVTSSSSADHAADHGHEETMMMISTPRESNEEEETVAGEAAAAAAAAAAADDDNRGDALVIKTSTADVDDKNENATEKKEREEEDKDQEEDGRESKKPRIGSPSTDIHTRNTNNNDATTTTITTTSAYSGETTIIAAAAVSQTISTTTAAAAAAAAETAVQPTIQRKRKQQKASAAQDKHTSATSAAAAAANNTTEHAADKQAWKAKKEEEETAEEEQAAEEKAYMAEHEQFYQASNIAFTTTADFLRWEGHPEMAQYLHRQAYELMRFMYDSHLVALMMTVYSNLAATFIAMEKYVDAQHVCDDAFRFARILDMSNAQIDAKLFFRRGVCALHLHQYEQAVSDLQEAATAQPKDGNIANKLKEAKKLAEAQREKEKRVYRRMFG